MNLKKYGSVAGAAVLAASLIALAPLPALAAPIDVELVPSTTYYVSASGSDSNNGTSEATPFQTLAKINTLTLQAGDKVLLKRGDTFNNQHLCISGDADFSFNDGTGCAFQKSADGAPVVISAYGEGAKPIIAANGAGQWKLDYGLTLGHAQHYFAKDAVSSTVVLKDAENIEITDIEITNRRVEDANGAENGCLYNDNCALDRTGIAGIAQNKGTLDHVVLKNLYVHDVQGNVYNKHSLNGAIYFSAFIATEKMAPESERRSAAFKPSLAKPTNGYPRFNDLQITDNRVENSNRWGIAATYSAYGSAAVDELDQIPDDVITKYGATNVVVSRNFIKNIGGDAITVMYGYKPLVESNVATEIATQMNTSDYIFAKDGSPTKFVKIGGRVAASIWPWKSKNAVFRFNEGLNTRGADRGNGDGMPWDADSGDGTLYEYNYSANNSGGTVMFCGHQAANSTFRFNIAQNDSLGALSPTYWVPLYHGLYPNAHVYNNTFYLKEGASILHPAQAQQGTMKVENNIFYNMSAQPRHEDWQPLGHITWAPNDIDGNAKVTYSNNLYYNYANYPQSDTAPVKVARGATVMVNPGTAPEQPAANMRARNHYFPGVAFAKADAMTSDFDGYKLAVNSPAIGHGKAITDWNGFALGTDFFGRTANTKDIGAVSTNAVSGSDTPGSEAGQTGPIYVEGKAPGFSLSLDGANVIGTVTLPEVEGVRYTVNGAPLAERYNAGPVVVKAVAKDGYTLGESATTQWAFVVPQTPAFDTATGKLTIPHSTGVAYDADTQAVQPGKTIAVTATPADGYSFAGTRGVRWAFTADTKSNPAAPQPGAQKPGAGAQPKPQKNDGNGGKSPSSSKSQNKEGLAQTGSSILGVLGLAAILGTAGIALAVQRRKAE
ncbi:MAG: hypothetical protein MR006_01425 [Arcanobacterium sp.]|nr:hypothetical protein [Arcanobacterium sp.]MDY5588705.1 hypothetical protein [Arcanobacterium sp.]